MTTKMMKSLSAVVSQRKLVETNPQKIHKWIEANLGRMDYPQIFASQGDEINTIHRDWDTAPFRICIVGAMAYRSSVGNLATPLLYSEMAEKFPKDWYVDRANLWETRKNFGVWTKAAMPIVGLQSHRSLADYDMLAFTCSYLQTIFHVGLMMKHSGIPYKKDDRTEHDPFVLVGGHHMYVNPESFWHVPDAIWVGEFSAGGPAAILAYARSKEEGVSKERFLVDYAQIKDGKPRRGFYVPSFYEEIYSVHHPYPIISKKSLMEGVPDVIPKAYSSNLDLQSHINEKPIVSFLNPGMGTAEMQTAFGCPTATCVVGDTIIFTSEGWRLIRDYVSDPRGLIAGEKGLEKSTHQWKQGVKEVFELTTNRGRKIEATADHRILTGEGWIRLGDLEVGERVRVCFGQELWPKGTDHSLKEAELIGRLLGDGSWSTGRLRLCGNVNETNYLVSLLLELDLSSHSIERPDNSVLINIHGGRRILERLTLSPYEGGRKEMPLAVRRFNRDQMLYFLRGYFDADGSVSSSERGGRMEISITLSCKWDSLLQEIQVYLTNLGIPSTVSYFEKATNQLLIISQVGFRRFRDEISSSNSVRRARMARRKFSRTVPHDMEYEQIKAISPKYEKMVYDITTPETESFVANGIVIHNCTFCSEGQTNKPFRFFSVSRIVKAMKEQMKQSGDPSITLSAFDGAGHPQKRLLIRRLLEEVSDKVSLLSLRVDEMAEDDIFSVVSTVAGNRTLSLGVEGMSERMRAVYQKHCSEAQILKVVEKAMNGGATKLKFFMIANHPWETEADRQEWVTVLKKVEEIRTRLGVKCQILTSWTPLVLMPFTPLQWEKPTVDDRTLHGIIDAIKIQTETNFRIGSGGRKDEAYMSQLFQLGDRRLSHLYDWCIGNDFIHYGATGKGMKEKIDVVLASIPTLTGFPYFDPHDELTDDHAILEYAPEMMQATFDGINDPYKDTILDPLFRCAVTDPKQLRPLGFHTWFRTKPYSEILPWQHLGVGVSQEWLVLVNEISKLGQQQIDTCTQQCSACGACSDIDRVKMAAGHLLKDDDFQLHDIKIIRQRGTVQKARLKLRIDRSHRYIENSYWQYGLRRAFYLAGLPVDKTRVHLVGQRYKFDDFSYGIEYADIGLLERVKPKELLTGSFACNLPRGMVLEDIRLYPAKVGLFRRTVDAMHFTIDTSPIYTLDETKKALEGMLASTEFIASIKQEVFRKGVMNVKTDVRPWVKDAWLERNGVLHLMTAGKVNPYELLPAMFKTLRRKTNKMDVLRQEAFLTDFEGEDQEDFFRTPCPRTGKKLPANLFDETDPTGFYLSAQTDNVTLILEGLQTHVEVNNLEEGELDEATQRVRDEDLFEEQMAEELALETHGYDLSSS